AFFKASNAERDDLFGHSLSLSNDGKTLAVGAPGEDSTAKNINGSQSNNSGSDVGAVYIFTRAGDTWRQQTYIKATTSENGFNFGHAVALSGNGEYLAVGVPNDDSGLGGVQVFYSFDNLYTDAGAVYMYKRNGNTWSTGRFVKSPNPGYGDKFGHAVALSANGNTLLAGAPGENGGSTGIDGDRSSNSLSNSGAAYLFGGGSIDELLSVKNAFLGEMSIKRNAFQGAIATSASSGNISYSSNSSNVTVYSNGALYSSRTSGKSTITVTSTGDRNYFAATMRYDVTVNSNNWSVRRSFDGNSVKINWQERPGTYRYYLVQSTNNGSYQPAPAARLVKRGATYEFIHNVDPLKLDWSSIRYRFRGCNVGNTYCTTISEFDLDDILTTSSYIKRFREPLPSGETRTQSERRNYGIAVAMNKPGTMLVAGSPGGNSGNGSARVYARDNNGVWRLDGQIQPRITYINGNFGGALAVSSTNATIAVGARGLNIGQSGFVYIFKKSSGVWREEARLRSTVLDSYDYFGSSVALSDDGNTLAVGAEGEDSNATGINGSATNNSAAASGAVYVFERTGSTWTQRYYIKANRVVANAKFGSSISLNGDGDVMAVGAFQDSTYSTGINGTIYTGSRTYSGAAYVFVRTATTWRQEAYIKPSSISSYDYFGTSVSLSGEGDILAVGAPDDDTGQTTGTGFVNNNSTPNSGAVTMYHYIEGSWRSTAFLKAANVGNSDQFGSSIALSANGAFLAVGAKGEDGGSSGINGNLSSNSNTNSGAVYYFERLAVNDGWSYKSYIKATSPRQQNGFGSALAISAGGNTMVVGAPNDLGYGVYSASTYDPGSFYLYGGHKVDRWLRTLGTHRGAMQAVYGQPIVGGVVSHTTYDPGYVYQAYSSFWLNYDSAWNRLYFHYRPTRKTEARIRVSGYGTSTFYPTATIYRVHISQHNIRTAVTLPEGKTRFTWSGAQSAHHYEIRRYDHLRGSAYKFHNVADIASSAREVSIDTALLRLHAGDKYALFACSEFNACALQSEFNFDTTSLIKSTYVKASNTGSYDYFGNTVAVSGDGNTMVVGAPYEDSNTTGINGSGNNNNASNSGAVYIYVRSNGQWTQQAYIKASNASRLRDSHFGYSIALLSPAYLVVGAPKESVVLGSGSSQSTVSRAGAVYVFRRTGTTWSEYKRLVASNPNTGDDFGHSVDVSLASNSLVVAVGAPGEDSNSRTTYNGTQNNNSATNSGAAYVFARPNYPISWSQQAYIKALNSDAGDRFGHAVALSRDASNLLVGAPDEDSRASGVNGINHDNSVTNSGAAYVFSSYREDGRNPWNFKNYIKASNPDSGDQFGSSVSMISYGSPLAIGAPGEDSSSAIINGSQGNPFGLNYDSGAAYVFNGMGSLMRQINYIKPSNPGRGDNFGATLSLHSYQGFLAVGARNEDSSIALEDGGALTADDTLANSGAVYTYEDAHNTNVRQLRFFKASNAGAGDNFGFSVSLGGAGSVLAIGANFEDGFYSGINRPSNNNSYTRSGATYIFESISD
ncbi:MAG: FG-GAP repeat protein, partial [Gammaproteobacteria bacterium]|nr:FG-GAP repeat protein [Gammaproteobacteria bacterium]